jgi:hydroxyethylthiazole kinase-like uncharacterized protein yjeF
MAVLQNHPSLWRDKMPAPDPKGHKYDRGIAVIYGAPKMTGALRLAARACARMGAGLVKVIAPAGTGGIYRSTLSEEIIVEDEADFTGFDDTRIKTFLIGPGMRESDVDVAIIARALAAKHIGGIVLDAGAFAAWQGGDNSGRVVATPHEGEFAAKFGPIKNKTDDALAASKQCGATIVLKGPQTVIAGAGEIIIQDRDVPELATAGTGDVLAGMITGLIAQGMDIRHACAAAVWIHAEAASRFGKGMVAGDLPETIPAILRDL